MTAWESRFSSNSQRVKRSAIREILKVTGQPGMISFAGGLPSAELFPVERIREASDIVLAEQGQRALQYSVTEGLPELRQWVADYASNDHVTVRPENVLITGGSQQALDLLGRLFFDPGDRVAIENPTYLGTLQAWGSYNLDYSAIPGDDGGADIDWLAAHLHERAVKMVYLAPNFQNPRGTTLTLERRQRLVDLLNQTHVPLIEDDPYGELRYSGDPLPSLFALDAARAGGAVAGNVILLGTLSKILSPGLRIGWIVAPEVVIEKLVGLKQSADLHTNTLAQLIAVQTLRDNFLEEHLTILREAYCRKRDCMLGALTTHFPQTCSWTQPDGGLFLMVTLPDYVDATELLHRAIEQNVAFVPGSAMHLDGCGKNTLRLNFSNATTEQIETGIARLSTLII